MLRLGGISSCIRNRFTYGRLALLTLSIIIVTMTYEKYFDSHLSTVEYSISPPWFSHMSDWNFTSEMDRTQSCQLPVLNPFDPSVMEYVPKPPEIKCDWPEPQLTMICRDGVLRFNMSAVLTAGYTAADLACFYQAAIRPDGQDDVTVYEPEQPMTGNDVMEHEFIYVRCANRKNETIYTNLHAHVRNLSRPLDERTEKDRKPSILVFFIDSLSRMNAIRYLPNTYFFLTDIMGAQVMNGMTRIGSNTWPNGMAMLTGRRVYTEEIETIPLGQYYDDYPVVWKNFSSDGGYVTLLAEDFPIYTLFNQLATGFDKQPTDHYFRPFWVALNSLKMSKASSPKCFGKLPRYSAQVNYIREFAIKYSKVPYFAYAVFTELGHHDMKSFGTGDDLTAKFLRELHFGGYLNDTILFFIGDHGHRTDPLSLTPSGRIEINMPFSAIHIPRSMRTQFPEIFQYLVTNSKRLTSNFDYYETFVDILRFATLGLPLGKGRTDRFAWTKRQSYSLFEPIPANRTCETAGIDTLFCSCDILDTLIETTDERAKMAANEVVAQLNFMVQNHTKLCATWKISKILSAQVFSDPAASSASFPTSQKVMVAVEVSPGGALFYGVVRLTGSASKLTAKSLGADRINRYRGQDSCLTQQIPQAVNFDIRPFCYCRSTQMH